MQNQNDSSADMENQDNAPNSNEESFGSLPGLGGNAAPDYSSDLPSAAPTGTTFGLHALEAAEEGKNDVLALAEAYNQWSGYKTPQDEKIIDDLHKNETVKNIQEKEAQIPSGGIIDSSINWLGSQAPFIATNILTEGVAGIVTKGATKIAAEAGIKGLAKGAAKSAAIGAGFNATGDVLNNLTTNVTGKEKVSPGQMTEDALIGVGLGAGVHIGVSLLGKGYRKIKGKFVDPNAADLGTPSTQESNVKKTADDIAKGKKTGDTAKINGATKANTMIVNHDNAVKEQPEGQTEQIAQEDIAKARKEQEISINKASKLAKEIPSDISDYSDGEIAALKKALDEYTGDNEDYAASFKDLSENIDKRMSDWSTAKKATAANIFEEDKQYDVAKLHEEGNPTHPSPFLDERAATADAKKAISQAPAKAFKENRSEPTTPEEAASALDQNDTWDHKLNTDWISTIQNKSQKVQKLFDAMQKAVDAKKTLPKHLGDYLSQSGHPSLKALSKFVDQAKEARNMGNEVESKENILASSKQPDYDVQNYQRNKIANDASGKNNIETFSENKVPKESKELGTGSPEEEVLDKKLEEMRKNGDLSPEQEEEIKQQKINELMGRGDEGFVKAAVACMTGLSIPEPTITYGEKIDEIQEER